MDSKLNLTVPNSRKVCTFFAKGDCKRGDDCPFSHNKILIDSLKEHQQSCKQSKDLRQRTHGTKFKETNVTEVCSFAVNGNCTRSNCKRSHDQTKIEEARNAKAERETKKLEDYANKLADEVCSFAVDGKCTRHDCRRSHDPKLIQVARDAKAKRDAKKLEDYANNLAGMLCKFEVNGNCSFGTSCKFSHDSEKIQAARDAKADYDKFVELQRKINNLFIK